MKDGKHIVDLRSMYDSLSLRLAAMDISSFSTMLIEFAPFLSW